MSEISQLPQQLDLKAVAGNAFPVSITCTGGTISSPELTLYRPNGTAWSASPGLPAISAVANVIQFPFTAADLTALHTGFGRSIAGFRYAVRARVNGAGPFDLIANKLDVYPQGTPGLSSSVSATLAITVGGVALALGITLGGSTSNIDGGAPDSVFGGTSNIDGGTV